ncbi:HNH endonuclease signature motif containing protein [Microbacterium sp. NPDC097977]|uniref:HNH endonuclease signature motif containing protein n=1 Tax=Microbacterium sp. NPDC097977 TaxID=3155686 RepID=UPI00332FE098
MMEPYLATVLARLCRARTVDENDCWIWQKSLQKDGYGQISVRGRMKLAHRVSYELHVGPISAGLELDHTCRVRSCVNPQHLEPVTSVVNTHRGLDAIGWRRGGGACRRGHERTPDNCYTDSRGKLQCRPCQRLNQARKYKRRADLGVPQRKATPTS